jgi:hypothetical protein
MRVEKIDVKSKDLNLLRHGISAAHTTVFRLMRVL